MNCDLVYFTTTQVRDMNDTSATRVRQEWYEATRVLQEWKNLILITGRVKSYFHTPILAIWLMKDYMEKNNFSLRTAFWKCIVPMPKCTPQKLNFVIAKVISRSYTLECSCNCLCTFPHSCTPYRSLVFDKNHFIWN